MIEFKMPSLGADMEDGTLTEWRVKPGDKVNRGDIIAEVDTQKGLIEVEVFDEGTIDKLLIKEGEKVPVGKVMATILPVEETAPVEKELVEELVEETIGIPEAKPAERKKISPLARKIIEEKGIDIATLQGTGPNGSIVKKDLESFLEAHEPPKKEPEEQAKKEEQKEELATTGIRSAIASAMSKSNSEIPHFYLETKIDMSKSLNWLKETNKTKDVKDRMLPAVLLIRSVAEAITEVPEVNAYWENGLQLKETINIGFAVSLRQGGVVIPAIRDADKKSHSELMTLLTDLIPRAKALKLKSSELSESTITLTSIGEGNVDKIFGIIYPPQVAIVGFGSITEDVWAENDGISVRPVIHVTLSADHRAIDGFLGGKFLNAIKKHLQNPSEL